MIRAASLLRVLCWMTLLAAVRPPDLAAQSEAEVTTYYPSPNGAYNDARVDQTLTVGEASSPATADVNGDVTVQGDLVVRLGAGDRFQVAPGEGSYSAESLRVDESNGYVTIGPHQSYRTPNGLSVQYTLLSHHFYAFGQGAANPQGPKYLFGTAFEVPGLPHGHYGIPASWLGWRALFGAKLGDRGTYNTDFDSAVNPLIQYAPLRLETRVLVVGLGDASTAPGHTGWQGWERRVVIGTDVAGLYVPPPPENPDDVFLQVGVPGDGTLAVGANLSTWQTFTCSRSAKRDISPLTPEDSAALLEKLAATDVVRYRFKGDPEESPLHLGVLAEEAPEDIVDRGRTSLHLTDTIGFLAAAMKALHEEHLALTRRLQELKRKKAQVALAP